MLFSPALQPLLHGASGFLDELLLFCLPLVVIVIILSITSRRARTQKHQGPRERIKREDET